MKYYVIAGERSGDLHASNLIKQLMVHDKNSIIRGMGGELMEKAGVAIFKSYHEISFMGFLEVVLNFRIIAKALKAVRNDLISFAPDVLILVDFSGFNMQVASYAKRHQLLVYYYISPKIWAWNQSRAWKVKKLVDKMFVILPFEKEFYKKYNYEVDYIGNPVNDAVQDFLAGNSGLPDLLNRPRIVLLPGSRLQEVQQMLKILDGLPALFPQYEFVIAAVSNIPEKIYMDFSQRNNVLYYMDHAYPLLQTASAAVVTSGTATLETALLMVPQIVVYKTSSVSYHLAKWFIKVKYISLVNLIAEKKVVQELIQQDFTKEKVAQNLRQLVDNPGIAAEQKADYRNIKALLGNDRASSKAAQLMVNYLLQSK